MDTLKLMKRIGEKCCYFIESDFNFVPFGIETITQISNHRQSKIYKKRIDPFSVRDKQFKQIYRFNKETVRKIID